MAVFVLDRSKHPLMPCSEKRARLLLERGRARVHRLVPFTIRLVDRTVATSVLQPLRLKLDPGSKVTGLAIVHDVVRDSAGFHQRTRHTCMFPGCNGATLVRQPYMTNTDWQQAADAFLKQHPCSDIRDLAQ